MLASRSVPMPTTARPNSPAPSWRMASSSVASASTTWVSVGVALHVAGVGVDAEHRVAEVDQGLGQGGPEPAQPDHQHPVVRHAPSQ